MYKTLSAPFVVQIEITEKCPNNCIHCYNYWRHGAASHEGLAQLNEEQINRIMDELERERVFEVVVTGGEPLLNKSGMFQIFDRVEASDFMFGALNSSLINLTSEDAKHLSGYRHLGRILTSLMGPTEQIHDSISGRRGSFRRTIGGIELLRASGVAVSVNMVVSKLNQDHIDETARLCKSLGVRTFNATRATTPLNCPDFSPFGLDLDELRQYLHTLDSVGLKHAIPVGALNVYPMCGVKDLRHASMTIGKRCSAGVTVAVISSKGNVRACTHLQDDVGSLLSEDLASLWERMSPWRDMSYLPQPCKECTALPACGGGCRAEGLATYNSLTAPDPLMHEVDAEMAMKEYQLYQSERRRPIRFPEAVTVNSEVRWRPEAFGSACFIENRCVGIFNADTTRLLFMDLQGKSHQVADLEVSISKAFLAELLWKGVLVEARKEVQGNDRSWRISQ